MNSSMFSHTKNTNFNTFSEFLVTLILFISPFSCIRCIFVLIIGLSINRF